MKRIKKRLSLFLAAILILASMGQALTAFAETSPAETKETIAETEMNAAETESEPETEVTEETEAEPESKATEETEAEPETEVTEETEAEPASRATDETEAKPATGAMEKKKITTVVEALKEDETEDGTESEAETVEPEAETEAPESSSDAYKPMPMSLLPLESQSVYLMLSSLTDSELKAVPLRTILDNLTDYDGNPVEIEVGEGEQILVDMYKHDEINDPKGSDYHLEDDYTPMKPEDTIDLSVVNREYGSYYTLELIVGKGKQLDYAARRYSVDIILEQKFNASLYYDLYDGNGEEIYDVKTDSVSSSVLSDMEIPVTSVSYYIEKSRYSENEDYELRIESSLFDNKYRGIDTAVYKMSDFVQYFRGETESLDNFQPLDILEYESRYRGSFTMPENDDLLNADNFFCIVYTGRSDGKILGYEGLIFTVLPENESLDTPSGNIYMFQNGKMEDVVDEPNIYRGEAYANRYLKFGETGNGLEIRYYNDTGYIMYDLKAGYSGDGEYYYVLDDSLKPLVSRVVEGYYQTVEAAENAEDITAQILPSDKNAVPYGYKSVFKNNHSKDFTIVYKDGTVQTYYIYLSGSTGAGVPYDDAPPKGKDPWFRVTGAVGQDGSSYNSYYVQNTDDTTYDTLYGYGYQTVLLDDPNADLSHIKPIFEKASNVRIQSVDGEELISRQTEQDFSQGPVFYEVFIDNNIRPYQVVFEKKYSGGPKLYVNYPQQEYGSDENKREIFLTDYFENRHDILIANIGDDTLTGLKVELIDPKNVVLDDYWVVGGESNHELKPANYYRRSTGEEDNLAKIRLLPDPEGDGGEISGTLKISADGEEDVLIELTGYASNPKIITEKLKDAVKYVPYSHVVMTNNMYDWNKVRFSLEEGKLPEGVGLNPATGEIYGVPKETGEFKIKVKASFSRPEFVPSYKELTLTVLENTNDNVYNASTEGYVLEEHIGNEVTAGSHDFLLSELTDQMFVSSGDNGEFVKVLLNGEPLVEGVDYARESGSTRITVKSQTFQNKAKRDGTQNTIAMEFRSKTKESSSGAAGVEKTMEMNETSQNFRIRNGASSKPGSGSSGSSGGSSSGATPSVKGVSQNDAVPKDDSWTQDEKGWRHQNDDGSWAASTWMQLTYNGQTEWYYFNDQGYMATGWLNVDGNLYYLNPNADGMLGKMLTGWQFIEDKWYYFSEEDDGPRGALVAAGWHELVYNNVLDWYYFNADRYMDSGWIEDEKLKYYLNPVSDGWKGRMLTGWQQIGGKWYYFNENSDGTKGAMMTDTMIGEYYVGPDGVWEE